MSSILKALKKLEQETVETEELPYPGSRIGFRDNVNRSSKSILGWRNLFFFLCLAAMIGIATVTLIERKFLIPEAMQQKEDIPLASGKRAGQEKETQTNASGIRPLSSNGMLTGSPSNHGSELKKNSRPLMPEILEKAGSVIAEPEKADLEQDLADNPSVNLRQSYENAPLDTSGFKLDAIVWSDNPQSSFAVINGEILREGNKAGTAYVDKIEKDYVCLKKGGQVGKLRFKDR